MILIASSRETSLVMKMFTLPDKIVHHQLFARELFVDAAHDDVAIWKLEPHRPRRTEGPPDSQPPGSLLREREMARAGQEQPALK
jgi:hypothetical protein